MLNYTLYPHLEQEAGLFVLFVRFQIYLDFFSVSLALEGWLKWQTNFRTFAKSNRPQTIKP